MGKPKSTAPYDQAALEQAALRYLERYDATAERLTQVLKRGLRRWRTKGRHVTVDEGDVSALIDRYRCSGLINDERFAENLATSLQRRGTSRRGILSKLVARGVPLELAERAAMENVSDVDAARQFARKRRLIKKVAAGHADRALAALARAGFDFGLARQIIMELESDLDGHDN